MLFIASSVVCRWVWCASVVVFGYDYDVGAATHWLCFGGIYSCVFAVIVDLGCSCGFRIV